MKNKYILIILIILVSNSIFLFGQDSQSSLSIYIYNESNSPLEGANVTIKNNGTSYGSSSDVEGLTYFRELNKGEYDIHIKFIGYYDFTGSIVIDSVKQYKKNIRMKIKSIPIAELEIISESGKKEITGAINFIDGETLTSIKPMGTQEVLEYIPGINGFSDDGIGNSRINIGIRGINPRRSSRVLVLEDGIPIQPAIYIYPNMYYNPPVERISKVEVIKGSASILYGPQTMGGVINYLTKRPSNNNRPIIKLTGGENGYISTFIESGTFIKSKLNPEFQFLYKRGDGFRENNNFEQFNGTLKFNFKKTKHESFYSKTNINYENSNATYTGLTLYSFFNNPNFNPKEYDNFELLRISTDLIHTKKINSYTTLTNTSFLSYFDRNWWREDDQFINENYLGSPDAGALGIGSFGTQNLNIVRAGNGETSSGRLRRFYVAGTEFKYTLRDLIFPLKNSLDIGARIYFERFIDDGKKAYTPDARDGYYYIEAEEYIDIDGNGFYDGEIIEYEVESGDTTYIITPAEPFTDCDINNPTLCEGNDSFNKGDSEWTDDQIVGQSHHYESTAFSGFISQSIELNSKPNNKFIIKPGLRFEIFEQDRVDLLTGAKYQDKTTFVILPGIGFNKQINNINIFGGIHRGFTPPSSGAIKVVNFGDNINDGGLDLLAEKSWNKEIGVRAYSNLFSSGNFDFELSLFHVDMENMVAAGRSLEFQNLGKIRSMGLEFSSQITPLSNTTITPTLYVTYSHLKTEVVDATILSSIDQEYYDMHQRATCIEITDNPDGSKNCEVDIKGNLLPYSPEHTLILGTSINLLKKITARVDYKYVSSVYTDFENIDDNDDFCLTDNSCEDEEKIDFSDEYKAGIAGKVPSYGIINLNITYRINNKLNASMTAKNLLDEIYIGSRLHSNPGVHEATTSTGIIPGPRRQINFSIEYTF